jgi:hypothetical protein
MQNDEDRDIPLRQATRQFPGRNGESVSLPTIYRWTLTGCKGIKLRSWQCGSVRCTSRRAIREFVDALTAQRDGQPPAERAPVVVRKKLAETAAELDRLGI